MERFYENDKVFGFQKWFSENLCCKTDFKNVFFLIFLLKFDIFGLIQDNPVGTGFSFAEDTKLFVKSDEEAATDLTTLLMEIFNRNQSLQTSPLYIVAESYGGKFAATLGLSALKAIESGKLKISLGGEFESTNLM